MAVDLTIKVRVGGFSRATDLINEVRAMLEREGWDPDETLHYEAVEVSHIGRTARPGEEPAP